MSIGTVLISLELLLMLCIMLFLPGDYAGPSFIGFAVGESLGAAALRIAGGIFTKIADIGSDLMKIVFNIKEDDARNPGVIADCTGDNAGDSVGPTADGFETYGVTGVALITFILVALPNIPGLVGAQPRPATLQDPGEWTQVVLLVWLFAMRIIMVLASVGSYLINEAITKAQVPERRQDGLRAPAHDARVADLARLGRPHVPRLVLPDRSGRVGAALRPVVEALGDHLVRHARRRDHPRARQGLHLGELRPRPRGRHRLEGRRPVAQHPRRPHRR